MENIFQTCTQVRSYPAASKSWLVVKKELYKDAVTRFNDTKMKTKFAGKRHLGVVYGSTSNKEDYK